MSQSSTASRLNTNAETSTQPWSLIGQVWSEYRWPCLILAAHLPMLLVHFSWLWREPQYQFFPILIGVVVYLIWSRLERRPEDFLGPDRRAPAYALMTFSCFVLAVATFVFNSPWLAMLSFILSFGGVLMLISEKFYLANCFGIWLLLWLLLPLPLQFDQQLSRSLQRFTTFLSADLLDRIAVPNFAEGTILTLPTKQLFVEEACSGVVSMMSIITACLVLAVLSNRPAIHTALLVASGVVWAATTNVLRIVVLAFAEYQYAIDLSKGWQHDVLGLCLFAVAIALALSADRLIGFLISPIEKEEHETRYSTWSVRAWDRIFSYGGESQYETVGTRSGGDHSHSARRPLVPQFALGVGFLVIGSAGLAMAVTRLSRSLAEEPIMSAAGQNEFVKALQPATMPAELDGWRMVDFSETHAERLFAQDSRLWTYRKGDLQAIYAVDFVFDEYHDLCNCYDSIGWEQTADPTLVRPERAPLGGYVQAHYTKNVSSRGFLVFSHLRHDGSFYEPPVSLGSQLQNRVLFAQKEELRLFQNQLWLTARRPISDEEQKSAHEVFQKLRGIIQQQLVGQS